MKIRMLAFVLLTGMIFHTNVQAESSGICGENLLACSYTLSDDGVLKIKGIGEMTSRPWFLQKETIKNVEISVGITSIARFAFADIPNLGSITIPDTVKTIGWGAFQNDEKLAMVSFGQFSNLSKIENFAFSGSGLQGFMPYLPTTVSKIGQGAFERVPAKTISIPSNLKTIRTGTFLNAELQCIAIPGSVKKVQGQAFAGCKSVNCMAMAENVEMVSALAFDGVAPSELIISSDQIQIYLDARGSLKNISKLYCSDGADACKAVLTELGYGDLNSKVYSSVYTQKALKYATDKTKQDFCGWLPPCKIESLAK